ncbi:MAG TPA: TolC family protein [Terrimicrobiaceae bacterium]|nr:TolC family protein [Terrimicrobiaceae bacterium]
MALASCMVGPNYATPKSAVESAWVESSAVAAGPQQASDILWWKKFRDPVLNRLIEIAYANNPTLQIAAVKILRARAELNGAIGNLFPQQQGISGGTSYYYLPPQDNSSGSQFQPGTPLGQAFSQQLSNNANTGGMQIGPNLFMNQLLFSSTWEIDFWGKYRRQVQADKATFLSSVAAFDNALVTLIGDVVNSYVNIRTTQAQIRVNQENVEVQKESLEIAEVRFQAGQTSQLDVEQAKTELAQTQAEIPGLENTLRQTKNGLAVQLGVPPADVDRLLKPGRLPPPPAKIAAGIPRDLLRRRPDVREAGLKAAAQSAKIGVEVANMLPAFSLNGTFGYSSNNINGNSLAEIFNWQNSIVQSAGSLTMPVFNYGRLINKVRVQDANFQEAVLNYQNVVLTAQKEVEDGLSSFKYGKQSVVYLQSAVESARTSVTLSIDRYKAGQTDYTTVLNAEQQLLSVENSLVTTQGDVMLGLVAVYRAVGGGWQMREGRDVLSPQVKEDMAKRRYWGRMLEPSRHLPAVAPEEQPVEAPKGRPWIWNLLNINK